MRAFLFQSDNASRSRRRLRAASSPSAGVLRGPTPGALRLLASLILIFIVILIPRSLPAQYPGTLRGRVLDSATGDPIESARAELTGHEAVAWTDGRGEFRLVGLAPDVYTLRVSRLGYASRELEMVIRNGVEARVTVQLEARPLLLDGVVAEAERDLPPGGTRISRAEIAASRAASAAELLDGKTGLVIQRRGPNGPQTVSVRGSAADQVLVLLDGAPLNDPVTGAADLSTIAASNIQSITVLRGSQSAGYGPGAAAGVVLIETRASAPPLEGRAGAGSLGGWSGELAAGGRTGDATWSAGGYARGSDGGFDYSRPAALGGGVERRSNNDREESGGFGSLQAPLAGGSLRVRAGYTHGERGLPGLSFVPSPTARERLDRWRGQLSWERVQAIARWSASLHGVHQATVFADPDPPIGVPFDTETESRQLGSRLSVELLPGGALESLTGGVELRDQRYSSDSFAEEAPDGRLDLGLSVRASLSPGSGARSGTATGSVDGRATGRPKGAFESVSPRLVGALRLDRDGLADVWRLTHEITASIDVGSAGLYLRHSSSFRPPAFGDQFFAEGVGVEPNPDLRAERIPSELGAGLSLALASGGTALHLALDAYRADVKDMIIWAPDSRFVWSPKNFDVSRRGLDVGVLYELPGPTALNASYSYARATYDRSAGDDDQQIIYRPRHTGSAGAEWRPGPWHLGIDLRYTGVRYPFPARVNRLDPFWTVDLELGRSFELGGWRLEPRLIVNQLTDNQDSLIFGYPEPGRTIQLELGVSQGKG